MQQNEFEKILGLLERSDLQFYNILPNLNANQVEQIIEKIQQFMKQRENQIKNTKDKKKKNRQKKIQKRLEIRLEKAVERKKELTNLVEQEKQNVTPTNEETKTTQTQQFEVKQVQPAEPNKETPQLTEAQKRKTTIESTYGRQPQRMADSPSANMISARIGNARNANLNANRLEAEVEQIKSRIEQSTASLESEMRHLADTIGTHNDEYQKRAKQLRQEQRRQKKEQKKETKALNAQIRNEKKIEKKETKKAGVKQNIDSKLLHQRDRLAAEMNQMKSLYGTANNEEYQIRLEQLKELDRKILGRKAKRVYRDLSKPIALIGGDYIELPKAYLDMHLQHIESKTK